MSSDEQPPRPAALITGAGSLIGIAFGIARRLADDGWDLALSYWRPADAGEPAPHDVPPSQIADDLRSRGATVVLLPGDLTVESFDRHMIINARASWQLIAAFARQARHGGAIVALTSDDTAYNLPYGASKGALDRVVIAAARELGHLGIRANAVNPGPLDTGWMDDELRETLAKRQPTGRLGTPPDVAKLIAFLLSEDGAWTTGQLIHTDGGFASQV